MISHIILYYPILSHIIPYYPILSNIIPYYPISSHIITDWVDLWTWSTKRPSQQWLLKPVRWWLWMVRLPNQNRYRYIDIDTDIDTAIAIAIDIDIDIRYRYRDRYRHIWLVVGPPLWKIGVRRLGWLEIPNINGKNKKCSKPPTRYIHTYCGLS